MSTDMDRPFAPDKEADKIVSKLLKATKKAQDTLSKVKSIIEPRMPASYDSVPQNSCARNVANQVSPFFQLPPELQHLIFSLTGKGDEMMFALSCKRAAQLRNEISQAKNHGRNRRKIRPNKNDRLLLMHRLKSWMNSRANDKWKLCYQCLKFRPQALRHLEAGWSGRNVNLDEENIVTAMTEGYRCPFCALHDKAELVKLKKTYGELKQALKK